MRHKAPSLWSWLNDHVLLAFAGRVLLIDTAVALRRASCPRSTSDRYALIAATTLTHGMAVVTRNENDLVCFR